MKSITLRASILFVSVLVFAVTAASSTAYAADMGDWGWGDYGTSDSWSDYGSNDNWSDYGSSDTWSDYGTSDTWSDYGTSDTWSDYGDSWSDYGTADTWSDYDEVVYSEYGKEYVDYYDVAYGGSTGCTWCGSSYSSPIFKGSGYSTGGGYTISGGVPTYIKPITIPSYPAPSKPVGGGSVTTNTTNTNITNIDNSIRDSFNNYNSGNTTIVTQAEPQRPVYYPPVLPPVLPPVQNLYCTIYANPQTIQNGSSATLSWTSTGATSAWLSDGIGSVMTNGSITVRPEVSRTYTLTVYGAQGTQTCTTHVNVSGAYVALTQIPYTGFDMGPVGNALYWAGLMSFAAAAAYLVVYYQGGALAFVGAAATPRRTYQPVVAPKAPLLIEREAQAEKLAPIMKTLSVKPTIDTMAIVQREGSMPKIVIDRS